MASLASSFGEVRRQLDLRLGRGAPEAYSGARGSPLAVFLGETLATARVAKAMEVLEGAGLLQAGALGGASVEEVKETLRGGGVELNARLIAVLRRLAGVIDEVEPEPDAVPTRLLRGRLRSIPGIGPATAEEILLSAYRRLAFPIRRTNFRVLFRHGWVDAETEEEEARELVLTAAAAAGEDDAEGLACLAGQIEEVARRWCKPSRPVCQGCPLEGFLPESGPREVDG